MHINIIAFEFAPFVAQSALANDLVQLTRAAVKANHTATVIMPFSSHIDVSAHSLARRLMPIKTTVEDKPFSCHKYDGRTSDGVNVYLLDINGAPEKPEDISEKRLFYAAACEVMASLSAPPDVCIAIGTETAGFAMVFNQYEQLAHLPIVSVISHLPDDLDESIIRDLEAADRIVLNYGRLYTGTLSDALTPLKEMLSKGHIQWMAKPEAAPKGPVDKISAKTAFQMTAGLPIKRNVPLILFFESPDETLAEVLTKDVQIVAADDVKDHDALLERYSDRLVLRPWSTLAEALEAADGAVVGATRRLATTSLAYGAVPIADETLAEDIIDLESTLESGSGIIIKDMTPPSLSAGLERLIAAFHKGADFNKLLSRLPGYGATWDKITYQFEELVKEIASEKKKDGEPE